MGRLVIWDTIVPIMTSLYCFYIASSFKGTVDKCIEIRRCHEIIHLFAEYTATPLYKFDLSNSAFVLIIWMQCDCHKEP